MSLVFSSTIIARVLNIARLAISVNTVTVIADEMRSARKTASQSFSRLYMIPGAYHCLFAPNGNVNLADFLTPLIAWVQRGVAPGTVPADTYSPARQRITTHENVSPYNALAPVKPTHAGLPLKTVARFTLVVLVNANDASVEAT